MIPSLARRSSNKMAFASARQDMHQQIRLPRGGDFSRQASVPQPAAPASMPGTPPASPADQRRVRNPQKLCPAVPAIQNRRGRKSKDCPGKSTKLSHSCRRKYISRNVAQLGRTRIPCPGIESCAQARVGCGCQ